MSYSVSGGTSYAHSRHADYEAIEQVLQQQEPYLGRARTMDMSMRVRKSLDESFDEAPPLTRTAARDLTDRIKRAATQICLLLLEAHDGRAWSSLGYRSWEAYARQEFRMSRSRSYELLDQARVLQAVRSAAEISAIPDISAYAAVR